MTGYRKDPYRALIRVVCRIHDGVLGITWMPYVCIMPLKGRGLFVGVKRRKQKCGVFRR